MPNKTPTLTATLSANGVLSVCPAPPTPVTVTKGGSLLVNATGPASKSDNEVTVALSFGPSVQDPFSVQNGGTTSFTIKRAANVESVSSTLNVGSNAKCQSDEYTLKLTMNGHTYSIDPMIIVDEN